MSDWRDCIVVLIDLIGIKKLVSEGNSKASKLMRSFHVRIRREMRTASTALDHAYTWNDSVLLLAYINGHLGSYQRAIRAADNLKRSIDEIAPSYAIAVKGQTFPTGTDCEGERVTVVKASSYALENCFKIAEEAKKRGKHGAWYIDSRIAMKVPLARSVDRFTARLLPSGKARQVHIHMDYLWGRR